MDREQITQTSVQLAGSLYSLLGWVLLVSSLIPIVASQLAGYTNLNVFVLLTGLIPGVLFLLVGKAIKDESSVGRNTGVALGFLLLLIFPIGTIIGVTMVWCLLQANGSHPMSSGSQAALFILRLVVVAAVAGLTHFIVPQLDESKNYNGLFGIGQYNSEHNYIMLSFSIKPSRP